MRTITLVLLLIVSVASAQPLRGYKPLSGKNFEELLSKALPSHEDMAKQKSLLVTVRIIPPFGIESQLFIICDYSYDCSLGRTVLLSSLSRRVNEALARGESHTNILDMIVESETETAPVDSALAQILVVDLWKSITLYAERSEIEFRDLFYRKGEIKVALDATSYQISMSHGENFMDVYFLGPDPASDLAGLQLSPLVRWSVNLGKVVNGQLRKGSIIPNP